MGYENPECLKGFPCSPLRAHRSWHYQRGLSARLRGNFRVGCDHSAFLYFGVAPLFRGSQIERRSFTWTVMPNPSSFPASSPVPAILHGIRSIAAEWAGPPATTVRFTKWTWKELWPSGTTDLYTPEETSSVKITKAHYSQGEGRRDLFQMGGVT
jgi:hypothetical protein